MTDKPNIDGATRDARIVLADIKQLADSERGRSAFATEAFLTVAGSHYNPKPADILIEAAEQGDPIAREAVHHAIMWYVAHGDPVPERLRNYLAEILILRDYGPKKRRGHKNYLRDQYIRHAVKVVSAHGFKPTRNEATREKTSGAAEMHSACSIVQDVLRELGVDLEEKTIEDICRARPE
jgi:hypothetical protein